MDKSDNDTVADMKRRPAVAGDCRVLVGQVCCRRLVRRHEAGVTLVEVAIVMMVLLVGTLGTLRYQYFAMSHGKKSHADKTALNTALLLLEEWKATGGATSFDPTALGVGVTLDKGVYRQMVNEVPMHLTLKTEDVAVDSVTHAVLRRLQVTVQWRSDYGTGELDSSSQQLDLETYVRLDQAGG